VDPIDSLPVIAEISIGLVGFTAVVAVLRGPNDLVYSLFLLGYSSATLILALLPFLFMAMGADPEARWQLSSDAMLICSMVGFAPYRQVTVALIGLGTKYRSVAVLVLALLNVVLQLANSFGMFGSPQFWPFLLGLLWYLVFCLVQFATLLFLRPSE
jgi:hypothetical protein